MTELALFAGGFAACLVCVVVYIACASGGARARDIALYRTGMGDGFRQGHTAGVALVRDRARQFVSVADDPMPATDLLTLLDLDMTKDNDR